MTPVAALPVTESRVAVAGQWTLVWWKFRKHKLALVSAVVLLLLTLVAVFTEFLAPFDPHEFNGNYTFAPANPLRLFDEGRLAPYACDFGIEVKLETMRREFTPDCEKKIPIHFFVRRGEPYGMLGLFETNVRLFGPEEPKKFFFLIGADRLGRDMFSRLVYGTRISMSIGLFSVFLTLFLGVILGGVAGYYGGIAR